MSRFCCLEPSDAPSFYTRATLNSVIDSYRTTAEEAGSEVHEFNEPKYMNISNWTGKHAASILIFAIGLEGSPRVPPFKIDNRHSDNCHEQESHRDPTLSLP